MKKELRKELLWEFTTPTSLGATRLQPMAPPFVSSDASIGVIPGEEMGGEDSTGTGNLAGGGFSSHVDKDMAQCSQERVGGGPHEGADILQNNSCQMNLKDGSLIIEEEEIPLRKPKVSKDPNCYKAVLTEGVCLPPLAEPVVPVRVDGAQADYCWELLEQPTSSFDSRLVARMLVDLQ